MAPGLPQGLRADNGVVWEEVACPLCGIADEEELLAFNPDGCRSPYRLVRCRGCGMGYLNPRPDRDSIGRFYPDAYEEYEDRGHVRSGRWAHVRQRLERLVLSHRYGFPPPLGRWYEKLAARALAPLLSPHADSLTALHYQGEGRLLDYGSGSGWYLARMRARGWQVVGMDFSPYAARQVWERYGIPVHVGTLPHPAVADGSLDVITMGCVLEHVHEPHALIAAAVRALRPGGLLVIAVPNLASWGFRFFGPAWWPLELPRHLLHFAPRTLRRLVEAHGLEICEERMLQRAGWMRRSLALLGRRPVRTRAQHLLLRVAKPRLISGLLTRWTVWTHQADCLYLTARRPREGGADRHFPPFRAA
jgi:SAM-dependent methyltransferase